MAVKLLLPVLPSEQFYDAVVAAGDLVAREGGTITFFFTKVRPPPFWEEKEDVGNEAELDPDMELRGDDDVDAWEDQMNAGLADARDLLLERGVAEDQIITVFGDVDVPPAEAVAAEAAGGAYDMVVLSKGAMIAMPEQYGAGSPGDIARAVKELEEDGIKLLVT